MVIWVLAQSGDWQPVELQGAMELGLRDGAPLVTSAGMSKPVALLHPWRDRFSAARYVLFPMHQESLRINGRRLFGHRLLRDRDEILIASPPGAVKVCFTDEPLPRVAVFRASGDAPPTFCLRCKTRIDDGQPAVRCPRCKVWYHQLQQRPCWSYDKECAECHRTTTMDYAWKPEPVATGRDASLAKRIGRHGQRPPSKGEA